MCWSLKLDLFIALYANFHGCYLAGDFNARTTDFVDCIPNDNIDFISNAIDDYPGDIFVSQEVAKIMLTTIIML